VFLCKNNSFISEFCRKYFVNYDLTKTNPPKQKYHETTIFKTSAFISSYYTRRFNHFIVINYLSYFPFLVRIVQLYHIEITSNDYYDVFVVAL